MTSTNFHYIDELPLLGWLVKYWLKKNKKPLDGFTIILVIHLLPDAAAFLEALIRLGVDRKKVFIVGKWYSTLDDVVNSCNKMGFKNILTPQDEKEFIEKIRQYLFEALKHKKVIIMEDGGYCVQLIRTLKLNSKSLVGIVEQTTIGIKRDKEQEKREKISFPIIDVASCELKKSLEPKYVAERICDSMRALLYDIGIPMQSLHILVVGYGSIGVPLVEELRHHNTLVVYDKNPIKRLLGGNKRKIDLFEELANSDIIVGCTGERWATKNHLDSMKDDAIFVCVTSERIEYSHKILAKSATSVVLKNWGLTFTSRRGKRLHLLAEGYPVNFYRKKSVPPQGFQIVSALLLGGILLLTKKQSKKGIIPFPPEFEKKIALAY